MYYTLGRTSTVGTLLSTADVAKRLNVTRQYIVKLVDQGKLTSETPRVQGQSMWFSLETIERFETSRRPAKISLSSFNKACNFFTLWEQLGHRTAEVSSVWHNLLKVIDVTQPLPHDVNVLIGRWDLDPQVIEKTYTRVTQQLRLLGDEDHLIWRDEENYPPQLAKTKDAPEVLFVRGNELDLLYKPALSIVGTRRASEAGQSRAYKLACLLCERGVTVASGLAKGIDKAAHDGALSVGGNTIAVIGTPLTRVYPKEHADLQKRISSFGLVVSQFYPGAEVQRFFFPMRNAVMSGLSLGTVVIEASETSGALIQAKYCLQQGHKLFIPRSAVDNPSLKWPRTYASQPGAHVFGTIDELIGVLEDEGLLPAMHSHPRRSTIETGILE